MNERDATDTDWTGNQLFHIRYRPVRFQIRQLDIWTILQLFFQNSNMSFYILETRIRSSLFLNGTGKQPDTLLYQICIVSSYVHGISSILLQISWISPDRLRIAQKKTSALHIGRKNWNSVTGGSWTTLFDRQAVCFRRAKEAGGQIKWAVP